MVIAVERGEITEGTIIIYEDPRRHDLVTHRVVDIDADGSYITRGDANGIDDPSPIPAANVRGVGQWVVPYVGQPRVWLDQGRWLMLFGFLVVTGTVTWLVRFGVDARFDPWRRSPSEVSA